jgi:hypothetical protein
VIGSRWIFTQKYHADGSFERYKGRLVAQGFSQRPGFEYLEVFAPTVRLPTLRIILALAALHDLHLWSVDVSNAYLNGDMDCDVYMEQPEGFAVGNPKDIVCLLKKSLYGTKQGGNRWNRKMRTTLESMGFKQTNSDAAVYIFVRGDVRIILPVFVDDMTFASTSLPAIKQAIADLSTHFKLRDLGPTTELLGIKIDRHRTERSLTYIKGTMDYAITYVPNPSMSQLFTTYSVLDSWIRQLESDVRNCELQCYRAYKHTWSPMSETKEH